MLAASSIVSNQGRDKRLVMRRDDFRSERKRVNDYRSEDGGTSDKLEEAAKFCRQTV